MSVFPPSRSFLTSLFGAFVALTLLGVGLAFAGPSSQAPRVSTDVTIPPDTPTLVEVNGRWDMRCPIGCKEITVPHGNHGETKTFCDCDNDGAQDDRCAIWLHTSPDNSQRGICKPGCPKKDEMCTKVTKDFPNGAEHQFCECDSPLCAGTVDVDEDGGDEETEDEDDGQLWDGR